MPKDNYEPAITPMTSDTVDNYKLYMANAYGLVHMDTNFMMLYNVNGYHG